MTQQEFAAQFDEIEKLNEELKKQLKKRKEEFKKRKEELRRQYIESNMTIPPGHKVLVDGKRMYLHGYRIIGYKIYPVFRYIRQNGSMSSRSYVPSDYKTMKACE